jgi:5'-methylthioadenosine phosphorylase
MADGLIGIIGGSGLGDALRDHLEDVERKRPRTPFGLPGSFILVGTLGNRRVAFLNRHGDGHKLNPGKVPYAANIFALKKLGVTTLLASGAVGSLRKEIQPKHIVLPDQFIDKTYRRQNSFFDDYGAVHCELDQPCCSRLRKCLKTVAGRTKAMTHEDGTYVCMEGPQFSTKAESLMHQSWGGDLIGMTAMPEAKLAREAQMCYALIALVSDYDCWMPHPKHKSKHDLLAEIIGNLDKASHNAMELILAVLRSNLPLTEETCTCRSSLNMAVWTQQNRISKTAQKQLAPLFE